MKYTVCETLMWHALTPALFRWLGTQNPEWDIAGLKRKAKRIYIEMATRTPEIGSLRNNSLRICLSGGMVWLSVYEAADGKMSEECFSGMVEASMDAPLVKGSFKSKAKTVFTLEAQQKRADNARKGNALSDSPFNWNTEVILGRDADEYTINYRRCGLCALGHQEGLFHLVPYMCALDIMSVQWMGGVLYRTKTLATGGDCCDFYICRKGSVWDRQKQNGPACGESQGIGK
ncbi:MAG: L-2-amino-thiazoline-4-carboxylic acid hydrolase [Eubacteriales bacterium]|nr:L-2-amino-thiazoline-4-carboxylic acid hydrolase [Eubacteriales bacterium]